MRTLNSTDLIVVSRVNDESAFFAWLEFFADSWAFKNLVKAARSGGMNVVATFGEWPPTHPGEWSDFEDKWYGYHARRNQIDTATAYKRFPLNPRPTYALRRQDFKAWGNAA